MVGGPAPTSFADDFADGDYTSNTYWNTISSWAVNSGRMENTIQTGGSVFSKDGLPHTDGTLSFKYKVKGTSSATTPVFWARFRDKTSGQRLAVYCYSTMIRLGQLKDGVSTIIDTNWSWGTVADTEYEVSLVADGNRVEVWMALAGQPKQRVLSGTTTVLGGDRVILTAETGCLVSVDDVSFTVPDPEVETFQYNNANELTRQVVDGFIQSFVYDDWGRMVTKTRGGYQAVYKYRFGDKLKQINTNFPGESAAQVEYTYDGLGKRRVMLLGGTAVQWQRYNVGWNVLGSYAHGGVDWSIGTRTNSYTWMEMSPLSETPGTNPGAGSSKFYLHDHLGSTRSLFDASRVQIARLDYEPHGQLTNAYGDFPGRSFTGKEFDAESGLYHFAYRHYSPDQARWMQRDPLRMVDGPNMYAYVRGALISRYDPFGLQSCCVVYDPKTGKEIYRGPCGPRDPFDFAECHRKYLADNANCGANRKCLEQSYCNYIKCVAQHANIDMSDIPCDVGCGRSNPSPRSGPQPAEVCILLTLILALGAFRRRYSCTKK
ncbi:MAG: RHS repeat-associated core domain-containing protein [Candidatus Competibacteraceae bacterium]|nr:RHS repeat-associated core domain-containing protein [Candidatus Competibacteraceae bacterium]